MMQDREDLYKTTMEHADFIRKATQSLNDPMVTWLATLLMAHCEELLSGGPSHGDQGASISALTIAAFHRD